jgi:hypothetical protein
MGEQPSLLEVASFLRRAIEAALTLGTVEALALVGDLSMRLANVTQAIEADRVSRERQAAAASAFAQGAN